MNVMFLCATQKPDSLISCDLLTSVWRTRELGMITVSLSGPQMMRHDTGVQYVPVS